MNQLVNHLKSLSTTFKVIDLGKLLITTEELDKEPVKKRIKASIALYPRLHQMPGKSAPLNLNLLTLGILSILRKL
jgi:hypothetical protein